MIKENQTQSIDLDLKGHDFIDSIMYIYYYGKTSTLRKDLGSNILIIGLVCALAGQLLTIIVVFLKNRLVTSHFWEKFVSQTNFSILDAPEKPTLFSQSQ